jgi:RNA polymerase sigma-70 factor (ECF subfamily)
MEPGSDHWATWFDQHAAALVLFAQQIVGRRSDAEDAVQEGFVRFWRHRREAQEPVAYLYVCVRSCALDQLRGQRRRRTRELEASSSRDQHYLADFGQREERRVAIQRGLRELPDQQRQVVVMKIWGGLTFAQIAEALDISPNTAASRYRYGLERLRETLSSA